MTVRRRSSADRARRGARVLGAALVAALALHACEAPPAIPPLPLPGGGSVREASHALVERVPVRLAAHEGADRIVVSGCAGGTRTLSAAGGAVRSDDGTRRRALLVEPAPGAGGLRLGDRSYPGRLRVETRPAGGLRVVNEAPIEEYVEGVVAAELVLWSAEPAELEAQAVAARTYALSTLRRRPDDPFLWDDTRDQAYRGRFLPANAGERRVAERLARAVAACSGRVLFQDGRVHDARFHASCGGHTATLGDVFPAESVDFRGAVPCSPCRVLGATERARGEDGDVAWTARFRDADLGRLARELRIGERLLSLRPSRVDGHGRWLAAECEGDRATRVVEWNEVRRVLGAGVLKSGVVLDHGPARGGALVTGLELHGVGRGHGVGLCQIGARELAAQGWSADELLGHYYPLARVETLSPARPASAAR